MALQVYSASPRTSMVPKSVLSNGIITKQPATVVCVAGDYPAHSQPMKKGGGGLRLSTSFPVRSSLNTSTVEEAGKVTEVNKDTFWPVVKAAGDKPVVVDMYTQWCGPCKIIAPKYQELSEKYDDVVFLKLDCNSENRPLVKELGLKVVPTFKIFKDSKIVKEVTGAKFDDLVLAIENARTTS